MKAIAAMSLNRTIGLRQTLPWPSIKDDFAFFKAKTMGQTIVMGRKTFDIVGPLKNRRTLILSNSADGVEKHCPDKNASYKPVNYNDLLTEISIAGTEVWICGGATVYTLLMTYVQEFYLTLVLNCYQGDVTMPFFEQLFPKCELLKKTDEIAILKYFK